MTAGYGRGTYSSGAWSEPIGAKGGGDIPKQDFKYLKRLRLQQQRQRDDEEVAALMLLQIMRGKNYG